jgi:hypothetical protein
MQNAHKCCPTHPRQQSTFVDSWGGVEERERDNFGGWDDRKGSRWRRLGGDHFRRSLHLHSINSKPTFRPYFLGRATNRRKFCSVRLRTPYNHDSYHRAIVTEICAGNATKMTAYRKQMARFPIKLPHELTTLFEELRLNMEAPGRPYGTSRATNGIPPPHGHSSIKG